jgi:Acetyltransferase (GNAT) domain
MGNRVIPHEWRYVWNNSSDSTIIRLRGWADSTASARPWLIRSVPAGPGVVLAYGGEPQGQTYILPFLEQARGPVARRERRRVTWSRMTGTAAWPDADILMVGCSQRLAQAALAEHTLLMPFRVTLVVPVASGPAAVLGRISRKARQQHLRETRSLARTLEIADRKADFDQFYDGMHRPTMALRHGSRARSETKESARICLFRQGVLFFLRESGQRVAGMLCRNERSTLVVRLAGVADSASAYHTGTYMSLYILILQWAAGHGFASVDLSGCEPFLGKGTFQFKRKMHPEVQLPGNHFRNKRLLLRVCRDGRAVRDFLVGNPVLAYGGDGGFQAVYFHDDVRPPRSDLPWETPGVTSRRLVHLDMFLSGLPPADDARADGHDS